jgi:hypothetical protein
MENIKPGMLFISADGDGVGKLVGRAILANDIDALHKVSNRIDSAQDFILHWCKDINGIKISGGGDEFTAAIPLEAKEEIKNLRTSIEKSFGYTISVGVGRSLSEAGTALLVAKLRGKDRIVYFNKKIKEDIKKAKRRVREGRASQEEYKLSEAYLEKAEVMLCDLHKHEEGFHNSAEAKEGKLMFNPDSEDNRTDDCAYCQDLDAEENADGTAGMHECPACKQYDADKQVTGGIELDNCPYCESHDSLNNTNPDNCEMCQEYNAAQGTKDLENITESQANPEKIENHECNCPNCPDADQTALAVEDMAAQRPDDCAQCQELYSQAIEEQPDQTGQSDPNLQGHETAEEILDLLDQEPGSGAITPEKAAMKIDNTELPQGDQMKENTSVKENFGDAQKEDISDSEADLKSDDEESPDMADVLKDGLNEHADDIQKQKTLDLVARTLQEFKANKESLEATKEQNQPLYNSCIQMLKAMIELCKLLGLEPPMPNKQIEQEQPTISAQESSPTTAPKEGAAEAPKAQS